MKILGLILLVFISGCSADKPPQIQDNTLVNLSTLISTLQENQQLTKNELEQHQIVERIYEYGRNDVSNKYVKNIKWLLKVVKAADYWSNALFTDGTANPKEIQRIVLSMIMQESGFNPHATDSHADSILIGQTRARYIKKLVRELKTLGYTLHYDKDDSYRDASLQVALCVLEYKHHLKFAHGDLWLAVQKYNGSGKKAILHRKRVLRIYSKLFPQNFFSYQY